MGDAIWTPAYRARRARGSLGRHRAGGNLLAALMLVTLAALATWWPLTVLGKLRPGLVVSPTENASLSIQEQPCPPWSVTLGRWEAAYVCRASERSRATYAKMERER